MTYIPKNARRLVLLKNLFLFLLTFIVSFEIILRITSYEEDSRIYVFGIYPVALPPTLATWEDRLAKLAEAERKGLHYSTYDSLLGWSYRPNYISKDSLYVFNEYGMRAHPSQLPDCSHQPNEKCLRILLSGNSYMMSAEVAGHQSLAFYLEKKLTELGRSCHVINGAAGNYSTDQAYLQWKYRAKPLKPDVVVLGINPKHFSGNTSVYPYCSFPETRIYYSKPRAVQGADSLHWINLPTVPPNQLLTSIIADFEHSSLYPYNHQMIMPILRENYSFRPYIWSIWQRYRTSNNNHEDSTKNGALSLSQSIISKFAQEVSENGSQLILVQTPIYEDVLNNRLNLSENIKRHTYSYNVKKKIDYIETMPIFDDFPFIIDAFMPGLAHYSPKTNAYLADSLATSIIEILNR
jgi:hypothetical protein